MIEALFIAGCVGAVITPLLVLTGLIIQATRARFVISKLERLETKVEHIKSEEKQIREEVKKEMAHHRIMEEKASNAMGSVNDRLTAAEHQLAYEISHFRNQLEKMQVGIASIPKEVAVPDVVVKIENKTEKIEKEEPVPEQKKDEESEYKMTRPHRKPYNYKR